MTKESSGVTRRQFLRSAGFGAGAVILAGCGDDEPIKRMVKGIREAAEEKPPVTNTPKATEKPFETNTPVKEAPTKTPIQEAPPTPDLEATRQVQAKLWERRAFIIGEGSQTGGSLETDPNVLMRQEAFKTNVYKELVERNILIEDNTWLLFGAHSAGLRNGFHPAQMDDSRFVALMGTKTDGQMQMLCFDEDPGKGMTVEKSCGGVKADEQIWGKDFETIVSTGKPEERQAILVGPEDNCFSFSVGALGATDILTPVVQDKEGNWIVDEKKLEEEGEKKGFLVTAGQNGKTASFMLTYPHVPSVPEGKTPEEELKLKDSIDAHFDIINGMIYVWSLEEVEGEEDKIGFHYCGYYSLETGEWTGEKGWEKYSSLFEAKAELETPTLEPGETLIGQDFIALPEKKILELLELPENEGKFACPVDVDEETRIKIGIKEGDNGNVSNMISIADYKEDEFSGRVLLNPSRLGVKLQVASRDYGQVAYFILDNGATIKVVNPDEILIATSKTENSVEFGQVLAKGFKNIPGNKLFTEEHAVTIFVPDPNNPPSGYLNASDFMLKYKDRWVCLNSSPATS